MSRLGGSRSMDSRYWLSILPYAACFVVWSVDRLNGRERRAGFAVAAFLIAFAVLNDSVVVVRDARWNATLADAVRPHVSPSGLTLCRLTNYPRFAVTYSDATYGTKPSDYELTAKLVGAASPESSRLFWAHVDEGPPNPIRGSLYDLYATPDLVNIRVRGIYRSGRPVRVIEVGFSDEGHVLLIKVDGNQLPSP
jgi:hypothetical protein